MRGLAFFTLMAGELAAFAAVDFLNPATVVASALSSAAIVALHPRNGKW
jgi:hypothetical protein